MSALPVRKHAVTRPRESSEELAPVFQSTGLKAALHRTIHHSQKSVEQIAWECRVSPSYIYRSCLDGESGCRFPLDLLVPLMRATGDTSLLDFLAGQCDQVAVKLPRARRLKRRDPQVVNEITANFNRAMAAVLANFESRAGLPAAEIRTILHQHLTEITTIMRALVNPDQGDLF